MAGRGPRPAGTPSCTTGILELSFDAVDAGLGAIVVPARGARNADRAKHFLAGHDGNTAADADDARKGCALASTLVFRIGDLLGVAKLDDGAPKLSAA
jgi:hypothetical protein